MAIGSTLGGAAGMGIGTLLGGPLGAAIGTGLGSAVGAGIEAIPALVKTDAEKENERRLAQLRRQQEMGTLGLTEAEKSALFGSQQAQVQGQLRQAQAGIRAAGAAGMGSGAGTAALQQAQLADVQAGQMAQVSRNVDAENLKRKRELEEEVQARIAAKSEAEQARLAAITGIAAAGVQSGMERYTLEQTIQGKKPSPNEIAAVQKMYGLSSPEEASGFVEFMSRNPQAATYAALLGQTGGR